MYLVRVVTGFGMPLEFSYFDYESALESFTNACVKNPDLYIIFEEVKLILQRRPKEKSNAIHASIHPEDTTGQPI